MKKVEVNLVFKKEFCEKVGELDFYNKLSENKVPVKELELFIIKNHCDDLNDIIKSRIESETTFKKFKHEFIKIKNTNKLENEIEVKVSLKVIDKKNIKSKLLHPFDFIIKKSKS